MLRWWRRGVGVKILFGSSKNSKLEICSKSRTAPTCPVHALLSRRNQSAFLAWVFLAINNFTIGIS